MGKGSLRRSINYAMGRYKPEPFQPCRACGKRPGRVRVSDRMRDRVWLICSPCAEKFIEEARGEPCAQRISDLCASREGSEEEEKVALNLTRARKDALGAICGFCEAQPDDGDLWSYYTPQERENMRRLLKLFREWQGGGKEEK